MLSLALHEENFLCITQKNEMGRADLDQDVAAKSGGVAILQWNWALGQDEQGIPDAAPYGFSSGADRCLRGYLKAS